MKRKSLALLLAISMIFGNSAGALAANIGSDITIEANEEIDDSEDIIIVDDAGEEQSDVISDESDDVSIEDEIEIEDAASDNSGEDASVVSDASVYEEETPHLTYMDVEPEVPIENPDLTVDSSYRAISDYTASKYVTAVLPKLRSQSPYGSCWAHASIALAEISLLKKDPSLTNINFSELHLSYFTYDSVVDPLGGTEGDSNRMTYKNMSEDDKKKEFMERGGNLIFSQNVLASWVGAADEAEYPYSSAADVISEYRSTGKGLPDSAAFDDVAHMTHYYNVSMPKYMLDDKGNINASFQDNFAAVKKLIVDYGAVGVSYNGNRTATLDGKTVSTYNADKNAFYYPVYSKTNHAIVIVGWDDDFSKDNFNVTPPGNGAWRIRNSWMVEEEGSDTECYNGYFWLSYYDGSLADLAYSFDFELGDTYDHNYQYDGAMHSGSVTGDKAANIFTVKGGKDIESLMAVSFVTGGADQNYTVEIYKNLKDNSDPTSGTLAATKSGKTDYEGYYTVDLDEAVALSKGDVFSVVLTLTDAEGKKAEYTTERSGEDWYKVTSAAKEGQSFIFINGAWVDYGKSDNKNIRIKAFTDDDGSILPTSISFDKESYTVELEDALEPVITVLPEDATNKRYTFKSSDERVVKVESNNTLTCLKAGTVTLTVYSKKGGVKDTATITVKKSYDFDIQGSDTVEKGGQSEYKVVMTPADAKPGHEVVFSSSDSDVLTIDSKTGKANAVSVGTTTITARIGERTATKNVVVAPKAATVEATVSEDNTVTLTWKHVGADYYEVRDGSTSLSAKIKPDSDNNCKYVDDRYKNTPLGKDFKVNYYVVSHENSRTSEALKTVALSTKKHSITYVLYSGTNDPSNPTEYTEGEYYELKDPTPPRGFKFEGWFTNPSFTGEKKVAITADDKDNFTLYAKYSVRSYYTITYELGGGTNDPANPATYTYETETITLKDATQAGYDFDGWYSDSSFSRKVTTIEKGSEGDIILYAKWIAHKYNVKFNGNGVSGSMATMKDLEYGTGYEIKNVPYKKKGYFIKAWATNKDGSGTFVAAGEPIKNLTPVNGATVTLYAQWEIVNYTITYDFREGNPVDNPATYSVTTKTFKLNSPTRDGYTFGGWYDVNNPKKKVTSISKGSTGNLELFAKWTTFTYNLKFNGNKQSGGKVANIKKIEYYDDVTIPANGFTKKGHEFTGWNSAKDGSGITYQPGDSVSKLGTKKGQNVTLYAQWKPIIYSISYEYDGADTIPDNPTTYNVLTPSFKLNNPEKAGFVFKGWFKTSDYKKKTSKIAKGSINNITLYAKWQEIKYTIKFNGNKATSGKMKSMTGLMATEKVTLTANEFKKDGYTFAGWNTKKDGSGDSFEDMADMYKNKILTKNGQTVTLYAQWK